ncbi:hypothetical protein KUTeg_010951 [Tegillarca granosa]|uniref:Uncharacterized protein n=1 Tax=Tegillarca granosa TaxID=220873 RepID=A0ABQ9F4T8_TEGGR|nr:hypothetical protein KUTeg_010951 [Tegillarca granosa]
MRRTNGGQTPLHLAASQKNTRETLEFLLMIVILIQTLKQYWRKLRRTYVLLIKFSSIPSDLNFFQLVTFQVSKKTRELVFAPEKTNLIKFLHTMINFFIKTDKLCII